MLNDLSALVPPLLVCVAFLVAVAAFLRYEMGRRGSGTDDEVGEGTGRENPPEPGARSDVGESFGPDLNSDSPPPPRHSDS